MSNILVILPYLIWLSLFILLLSAKKFFVKDQQKIGAKSKLFLIILSILVFGGVLGSYGWAYYKLYTASDGYKEVAEQVIFHVHKPTYLPENIQQMEKYHTEVMEDISPEPGIRSVYSTALRPQDAVVPVPILAVFQFQETASSNVESYISFVKGDPKSMRSISEIDINGSSTSYLIEASVLPLKTLVFSTNQGTVVVMNGLRVPEDELIKVAESLE